ncbi:MAG: TolC family protein [Verrucomicrobia bacterium]|nr:TolC family protein [Verrucomicrobiota bacterium]
MRAFIEKQTGGKVKWSPARQFGNWTLEQFTLAAFFYHPSLDVARAQLEAAKAAEISAGARPNPTASLSPGYNFSTVNAAPNLSHWFPGVDVDVPIETAGKRGLRMTLARHRTEVARLNLYSTAWKVRANVRDSVVQHDYQRRLAIELDGKLGAQKQLLDLLEERFKAGAISQGELSSVRVAYEKTKLEVSLAGESSRDSLNRLAAAIGVPPRAEDYVFGNPIHAPRWPELTNVLSTAVKQAALQNRADLRAALAEYAATQAALQLEIAKQYPDIHLGSGYQWDQGDNKWTILKLSLDLPLFNRNQGAIAEARARREEAAARFIELQAQAIADIGRTMTTFQIAYGRSKTTTAAYEALKQQGKFLEAQMKAGAADAVDLAQLRIEQASTAMILAEVNYRAEVVIGQLEDALQLPLDPAVKLGVGPTGPAPGEFIESNPRVAKEKP